MYIKLEDPRLFGNFAAEDEDIELLDSYFVDKPGYKSFRSDDKLCIVRAKKGMGKSALLKKVAHEKSLLGSDDIVVQVKGSEIIKNSFPTTTDIQQLINVWQTAIYNRVNIEIGKIIGFNDKNVNNIEFLEIEEFKGRNLIYCLVERMIRKLEDLTLHKPQMANVISSLIRYQQKSSRKVWLFVDDIDATFKNTEEESKRLSSFFTACRYIIHNMHGLYIRASVRTDVWAVIADKDESLDKVDQPTYMMDLSWSELEVKNIIANRIRTYILNNTPNHSLYETIKNVDQNSRELNSIMNQVFKGMMPWGSGIRKPSVIIFTLSNRRPRWAIHLCSLAGQAAARKQKRRIGIDELTENLDTYGKRRITDIVREHEHQSENIREFVNAFAKKQDRYSTEELLEVIRNEILSNIQPKIEGVMGITTAMDIAHFLFRMGFITAREDLEGTEYKHYSFEDDHSLLNSKVNPDKGYIWEIHPSFRTALRIAESDGGVFSKKEIEESKRHQGRVKWFNVKKGFGFIDVVGYGDIYVHYSSIIEDGFKKLDEGQIVEFNIEDAEQGTQAINVKKLGTT